MEENKNAEALETKESTDCIFTIADEKTAEKTCPFCKVKIHKGDEIAICPKCEIAHHKECWEENKGCTTFGCDGKAESDSNLYICKNCGNKLRDDQLFCPNCGTPKELQQEPQNKKCKNCGTELSDDALFCPNCGQKAGETSAYTSMAPTVQNLGQNNSLVIENYNQSITNKSKNFFKRFSKKVTISVSIVLVLVITLGIFCIVSYNITQKKISDAMIKGQLLLTKAQKALVHMEDTNDDIKDNVQEYEDSDYYYYNYSDFDSEEDAIKSAIESHEYTLGEDESSIDTAYDEINSIEAGNNEEIINIKVLARKVYDNYVNTHYYMNYYDYSLSSYEDASSDFLDSINNLKKAVD